MSRVWWVEVSGFVKAKSVWLCTSQSQYLSYGLWMYIWRYRYVRMSDGGERKVIGFFPAPNLTSVHTVLTWNIVSQKCSHHVNWIPEFVCSLSVRSSFLSPFRETGKGTREGKGSTRLQEIPFKRLYSYSIRIYYYWMPRHSLWDRRKMWSRERWVTYLESVKLKDLLNCTTHYCTVVLYTWCTVHTYVSSV